MGLCTSGLTETEKLAEREAKFHSRTLDQILEEQNRHDDECAKILVIGPHHAGKGTFLRQLRRIYGRGFSDADRSDFVPLIHSNVIEAMKLLVDTAMKGWFDESVVFLREITPDAPLDFIAAKHIGLLWKRPEIKSAFARKETLDITVADSAPYFFNKIGELCQVSYVPSEEDVIRSHFVPDSVVEYEIQMSGSRVNFVDVGCQFGTERKHWIHSFEGVSATFFFAPLSCYDESSRDYENTMSEVLRLYEDISHSRFTASSDLILFLTKKDLFDNKLFTSPLTVCPEFSEYKGLTADDAIRFVADAFRSRNPNRTVFIHWLNMCDIQNVQQAMNSSGEVLFRWRHQWDFGGLI